MASNKNHENTIKKINKFENYIFNKIQQTALPTKISDENFTHFNQYEFESEQEKYFANYMKPNRNAASLIVAPYLYLGDVRSVRNVNDLINQGITHVLNSNKFVIF